MEYLNLANLKEITFIDERSVYIEKSVKLGKNIVIYPNNIILGNTEIKDNVVLLPNNYIINSLIKNNSKIFNSVIEDSVVEDNVTIGPFAHLRPNSNIKSGAKIGNFVEIKNSLIGEKSKVSHLSYVGDANVGANVNIGCGVVFVNYNGKTKSKSEVEDNCFVGSSVNVIAPVKIEKSSYICAGTTVDKNVPENSFVIGRSRMVLKPERAKKYLKGEE